MKTVAVFALLLLASFCFADVQITKEVAQDPVKCGKSSDCYDMTGSKLQYCNIINGVCAAPTQQPFGSTLILSSESNSCQGSFLLDASCVRFASAGCPTPADNKEKTYTYCAAGSGTWNGTSCSVPTTPGTTTTVYKKELEVCTAKEGETCGFNLACVRGICRKMPSAGEPCYLNACTFGLTCNLGYCTAPYSLPALSSCTTNDVCTSGTCTSGFCRFADRNQGCFANGDCTRGECDNRATAKTSKGQGRCFYPASVATIAYTTCIANAYGSTYYPDTVSVSSKCDVQEIKLKCSQQCPKRADMRAIRGDNNVYDCLLLSKTPFKSDQCSISEQFKNCDAYQVYENAATGFSAPAKMILMLALSAIALVFLL